MSNKDLDSLIDEALDNIRNDRRAAREFLNDIATQLVNDADQTKYLSPVAAKHIETLQRSNEQLVKVSGIVAKKTSSTGLTADDKEEIYDLLNEEGKK